MRPLWILLSGTTSGVLCHFAFGPLTLFKATAAISLIVFGIVMVRFGPA